MSKAVIMAGGQGERFWPLTHKDFPKYRLRFGGKRSLLQKTHERLAKVYGKGNLFVVTTEPHVRGIREELPKLPGKNIFVEPFRNNTCAAIYLSCRRLEQRFGRDTAVSFFPADHLIQNEAAFRSAMKRAVRLAERKKMLVTIGIHPAFPATGYGYIQKGKPVRGFGSAFAVQRFVEKPDRKKAQGYVRSGKFLWNAGMFSWRLDTFFEAMDAYCPTFRQLFDTARLEQSYKKLPNLSIDFALMEKAANIAVCPTRMDWCDMGSWDMFFEKSPGDDEGNRIEGFYYCRDTRGSLVVNQTTVPLVVLGVSGLIVVQTPRGTLICRKGRSEEAALLSKKL